MAFLKVGEENSASVELYYEDHGSGSPVVLIHGWPLSGRSWEKQVPALVDAGHRVITYDRRGFGKSSQPWEGYDYDTFAADLEALLSHLDLQDVTLVGFSMGGGEIARYIGNYGTDRVSKAVLASAVPPYLYQSDDNPDGGLDDATIEQFEDGVKDERLEFLDTFTAQFLSPGQGLTGSEKVQASEQLRLHLRDIAAFASPKGTLDCIAAFGKTDFRDDLAKFDVPTLIIHGDSDQGRPVRGQRPAVARSNRRQRAKLIEGGPHGINATHAEQFNRALLDFLG